MNKRSFKYLVSVAMYFFVWSPIQKSRVTLTLADAIMNNEDSFDSLHLHL